jgi:putative endonuclease
MKRGGHVYIITNKHNTTLYTGVTSDLKGRILKHINKVYAGSFSARYNLNKLVYYEYFDSIVKAIKKEKEIKNWKRQWKIDLIESMNPEFKDLYPGLLEADNG